MRYIGWDTEAYLISKHRKATRNATPRFVCLTWYDGEDAQITKDRVEAIAIFKGWLEDPEATIIAHNAPFDVKVMLRLAREEGVNLWPFVLQAYEDGRIRDTAVREILIDIAAGGKDMRGYSLARLEQKYLSRDRSDQKTGADIWRLRYNELAPYPIESWPQEAIDYALDDAIGAYDIFRAQTEQAGFSCFDEPMIEEGDRVITERFQTLADFTLGLASSWGLSVDPEKAEELDTYYERQIDDLIDQLKAGGLVRECGTRDARALQEIVLKGWEEIGQDPPITAAGQKKIDAAKKEAEEAESEEERERILREGLIAAVSTSQRNSLTPLERAGYSDPRFKALTEYNRSIKFRSTYLEPIVDAYPYAVCPGYNVLVDSGRTSSWGPNVQNIPSRGKGAEIRHAFIARPGNAIIQCDYSTIEMRTLAQVNLNLGFGSRMAEALQFTDEFPEGRDLHLEFACSMNGWDYKDALARRRSGDKEVAAERELSKIANFGYPGGLGAGTFVEYAANFGATVTPEQSQKLRDEWFRAWPEMHQYFQYINACTRYDGKVMIRQHGPYGAIEGWRIRLCDRYTSACNTLFQGLAADAIKLAMWNITKEAHTDRSSPLWGYKICAMIHDEILMEGPEDRADEAAARLSEMMIEAAEVFCPDIPILAEAAVLGAAWKE